jgi:hypothetical protein
MLLLAVQMPANILALILMIILSVIYYSIQSNINQLGIKKLADMIWQNGLDLQIA